MRRPVPPRLRRPPLRVLAALACVLAVLGGAWLWLRDSRLVAVREVTVTGASGPDAGRVRDALEAAAEGMTTLHVRGEDLRSAVEPFPEILDVRTRVRLPHRLRIAVRERTPVGAVVAGDQRVAVAADGTLMRTTPSDGLPEIAAKAAPGGPRVTDRRLRRAIAVMAAAPPALRAHVRRVYVGPRGMTVPLRDGPTLYFGGPERLTAKWVAAATVLGDPTSTGATYIDLRLPERPAAGGLEQAPADASAPPPTTSGAGATTTSPPTATAQTP